MKKQTISNVYWMLMCGIILITPAGSIADCVLGQSDVVTLYFGVESSANNPDHPETVPTAHTDIEIPLRFFDWDIHIATDAPYPNRRIETEQAFFALTSSHRYSFSSSVPQAYEFLGVTAGQTFWYYPQSSAPSPGFDSQNMTSEETSYLCWWDPNDFSHGANTPGQWLRVQLVDVRGPQNGHVSMWQDNTSTPSVFFSTFQNGIGKENVYYIKVKNHSHNSWAFTQPGVYEIDLQISTYYNCDNSLTGDLNDDCFVNLDDYSIMSRYWLATDCSDPNACQGLTLTDPNEVNLDDLYELTEQWLLCGSPFESECP